MYTENNIVAAYEIFGLCTVIVDKIANFQGRKILVCIKYNKTSTNNKGKINYNLV